MADEFRNAVELAAKQLSYRPLSAQKLYEKLIEKGQTPEAASYAVAFMLERKLLDDQELAYNIVQSYQNSGYGSMRIQQELRQRGIEREDAQQALACYVADMDRLLALLDKRLQGDLSDRKQIDKAIAALARRGFTYDEIRNALSLYGEQLDEAPLP